MIYNFKILLCIFENKFIFKKSKNFYKSVFERQNKIENFCFNFIVFFY